MKFNQLIPELSVASVKKSLEFYHLLGFQVEYAREGFAFISLGESQLMLDEIGEGRTWKTGEFEKPLGRGINFQIEVDAIQPFLDQLAKHNISLFMEPEEKWYRKDTEELGNKQFLVQDPDGYLLRFAEDLGTRPLK